MESRAVEVLVSTPCVCGVELFVGMSRCALCRRPVTRAQKLGLRRRCEALDARSASYARGVEWFRYGTLLVPGYFLFIAVCLAAIGPIGVAWAAGVALLAPFALVFFWSRRSPIAALLAGLAYLLLIQAADAASAHRSMRDGLWWIGVMAVPYAGGIIMELLARHRLRTAAARPR